MSPSSAVVGALVASLWQVTALAALFAVFRLLARRPQARYLAAVVTLALQVAWPAWTFARLLQVRLTLGSPVTMETSGRWNWLAVAWAAGAALMLAHTAGGLWVVRRWAALASALPDAVLAQLEALRSRLGVRAVRWAASAQVRVPLTVGVFSPVVFLPASVLTGLPAGDLELIAAHELMHVRRWDYLVNLGQAVVEAALFFHPAMWWVSRCAREEREYCCDDAVLAELGGARSYAHALLSLEESMAVAVAVPSTGGAFMNRIRRILGVRGPSSLLVAAPVLALVLLTAGLAWALRAPAEPSVEVTPELAPVLRSFCADLTAEVARPEMAQVARMDLATVVLADLGERNPVFERFLGDIAKFPPAQRKGAITRTVSNATGTAWQCPAFDQVWDVDWPQ